MFLLDNPFQYKVMVDNWERDLLELGFAKVYSNGKTVIPIEQLKKIINIDETCLVLDGSKCNRGGRPEITFYILPIYPTLDNPQIKLTLLLQCTQVVLLLENRCCHTSNS